MIVPQEDLLKKLSDTVMKNQQMSYCCSQNSSELVVLKESTTGSTIGNNPVEHHGIFTVESATNVRKRAYPLAGKTILKHRCIGSDCSEGMFSSDSGNSQSLETRITVEPLSEDPCYRARKEVFVEQEEVPETSVVDASAVKLDSNSDAIILKRHSIAGSELSIQQMMADFVPN